MKFRPCIDIHNGKVKQIVGSSLKDEGSRAVENFVSEKDSAYYASLYRRDGLRGGHVIILNAAGSEYYEASRREALAALSAFPGGMMAGGGITPENAGQFLTAGASHVIVTSFVFKNGIINYENLRAIGKAAGKDHLVLDLSCRKRGEKYYIVTDRWQKFTDTELNGETLRELGGYCSEYLVHAVDVEGKQSGVDVKLTELLADESPVQVTYAGGIGSFEDIEKIRRHGKGRVDFTVGSALDLFGGHLPYEKIVELCR